MEALKQEIEGYLRALVEKDGSDLILKAGRQPVARIYGDMLPLDGTKVLTDEHIREMVFSIITEEMKERLLHDWELDFAYEIVGLARYRVNLLFQRTALSMVARVIPLKIKTAQELNLPPGLPGD
ncbi:MAG TPA: type IV pili twitching motility protein PilT, partial [Armatimonadota bacterium]|nr:type IV pili twitching motility protein PilT [Armatimonadota bacterium]